jgi:hypothetical protein
MPWLHYLYRSVCGQGMLGRVPSLLGPSLTCSAGRWRPCHGTWIEGAELQRADVPAQLHSLRCRPRWQPCACIPVRTARLEAAVDVAGFSAVPAWPRLLSGAGCAVQLPPPAGRQPPGSRPQSQACGLLEAFAQLKPHRLLDISCPCAAPSAPTRTSRRACQQLAHPSPDSRHGTLRQE